MVTPALPGTGRQDWCAPRASVITTRVASGKAESILIANSLRGTEGFVNRVSTLLPLEGKNAQMEGICNLPNILFMLDFVLLLVWLSTFGNLPSFLEQNGVG